MNQTAALMAAASLALRYSAGNFEDFARWCEFHNAVIPQGEPFREYLADAGTVFAMMTKMQAIEDWKEEMAEKLSSDTAL